MTGPTLFFGLPFAPGAVQMVTKDIAVTEIRDLMTKVTPQGLQVRAEFEVQNLGKTCTVRPYVEYKIAEPRNGKYQERIVRSDPSWVVKLDASVPTTISHDAVYEFTTRVVAKRPRVGIELV
jgi:hypothetical protein